MAIPFIPPTTIHVMTKTGPIPSDKVDETSLEGINHIVVEVVPASGRPQDARMGAFVAILALVERCMEAGFIPVGGMTDGGLSGGLLSAFRQTMTRPR